MSNFSVRFPVRFGDVDHAGIVYYPRFFHYFHMAFEEMFKARFSRHYVTLLDRRHIGFPTVSVQADFRRPLAFGDEFEIALSVLRMGRSSIDFRYELKALGVRAAAAEATITVVCIDRRTFRARTLPVDMRRKFSQLMRRGTK